MADDKPGPPKSTTQKHTLDVSPRFQKFIEELELPDDVTNLILANQTLKRFQLKVDPAEIALLGGGFYLGYAMNMRPGIEVPSPLGGTFFLGLPDFGAKVKDLQFSVDSARRKLAEALERDASDTATLSECQQGCQDAFNRGEINTTQLGSCIAACGARKGAQKDLIEDLQARLAEIEPELRKHRIAQGFLFLIMTWVLTRPGFIQGIGEIIPG